MSAECNVLPALTGWQSSPGYLRLKQSGATTVAPLPLLLVLVAQPADGQVTPSAVQSSPGTSMTSPLGGRIKVDLSRLSNSQQSVLLGELNKAQGIKGLPVDDDGHIISEIDADPLKLKIVLDKLGSARINPRLLAPGSELGEQIIDELRRRQEQVQQTVGPRTAANELKTFYSGMRASCTDEECRNRVDRMFAQGSPLIDRLLAQSGPCDTASVKFGALMQGIAKTGQIDDAQSVLLLNAGKPLDRACLAAPWDAPSSIVAWESSQGRQNGALQATALLQLTATSEPFCGGLFTSRNTVITALHCFGTDKAYAALRDGKVIVRQAGAGPVNTPSSGEWTAAAVSLPTPQSAKRQDIPVTEDLIELRIAGGPQAVPAIRIAPPSGPGAVFVPGYFFAHDRERRPAGSSEAWPVTTPVWWRGLRWSLPETCVVADPLADCFRILCQTSVGYSGTPVFATSRDPNGTLVVHGIVKGSEGRANVCRQPLLNYSTIGIWRSAKK